MSKILPATCDDQGQVFCEDYIVPEAIVMTEGKQSSEGILILDKDLARYLTTHTSDIKSLLEKISGALDQVASGLEGLDTAAFLVAATGGVASPPIVASNISQIRSLKGELDDLRGALK